MSQGYTPPVNAITTYCGLGGIIASLFGGTNVNIAGPMTAICSAPDAGPQEGRYASVLVNALIYGIFGITASVAVPFVVALPPPLISTIAGLAMINVLLGSLQHTFSAGKFQVGAFFSLCIAMSGITVIDIAAPVWALAGGVLVSLLMERQDFKNP
jgi:benzoate membrane transport protein